MSNDALTLAPRTLTEAKDLAKSIHGSSLLPAALKRTEADVLVTVLTGQELGLLPMQSMRAIHVIEGKPTLSADAMAAIILASPVCDYFRVTVWTHERCVVEAKRKNDPTLTVEWTMKDAAAASLLGKDVWKKYPRSMLRARAISAAAHNVFPDIILGVYTPEELGAEPKDVNERPAPVPATARPTVVNAQTVELKDETPTAPVESSYPAPGLAPASFVGQSSTERAAEAAMDAYRAAKAQEAAQQPKPTPPPAASPDEVAAAEAEIAAAPNMAALAAIGNRLIKTPHWKQAGLKEAFTLRQQQLVSGEKAEAARGAA